MIKIEIYTLGHSNYPFDKFIEILKNLSKNEIRILSAIHTSLDRNDLRYNKNSYVDGNVVREHLCLSKEE